MGKKPQKQQKQQKQSGKKPQKQQKPLKQQGKKSNPRRLQEQGRLSKGKSRSESRWDKHVWSEVLGRWVYPFEHSWDHLSKKAKQAARRLGVHEGKWDEVCHRREVADPLGCPDLWCTAPSRDDEDSMCAMQRLGLLWSGANVAGFRMVHEAFRTPLSSLRLSASCERQRDLELFTLTGHAASQDPRARLRPAVSADLSLCYWDVLCPAIASSGCCEFSQQCPFALSEEELGRHPAVFGVGTHRHCALSFEAKFGKDARKVIGSPASWACNLPWWQFSFVARATAFDTAPLLELELGHGTLGPGRCGPSELRYLILPESADAEMAFATVQWQIPPHYIKDQPGPMRQACGASSTWNALRYRLRAWCARVKDRRACTCLEALPFRALSRVFNGLTWREFSALQACSNQFAALKVGWEDGRWTRMRETKCLGTQLIAEALRTSLGTAKHRGGSWWASKIRERARKRRRLEALSVQSLESRVGETSDEDGSRFIATRAISYGDDRDVLALKSQMVSLAVIDETLQDLAVKIATCLRMPFALDADCSEALLLWNTQTMLERVWSWNVLRASEPLRRRLVHAGFGDLLHKFVQRLLCLPVCEVEIAMEVVLRVLACLSFVHSRQPRRGPRMAMEASLARTVLTILHQFASNELVVARCLSLIAALVYNCDVAKRTMGQNGGIDPIVAAMVAHEEVDVVFSAGMTAFANYTFPHEQGRAASRIIGFVTPKAGRLHSLCSKLFAHCEANDEVSEVSMEGQVELSLIHTLPQGDSLDYEGTGGKSPVRHLYLIAGGKIDAGKARGKGKKQVDVGALRERIKQALVDNIGYRALGNYGAVLFYSAPAEYNKLQDCVGGISPQLSTVRFAYVPKSMKTAKDNLELWFLWTGIGPPTEAPPWMPHELACKAMPRTPVHRDEAVVVEARGTDDGDVNGRCLSGVHRAAVVLRDVKELAQARASLPDEPVSREHVRLLEHLSWLLQEANDCELCKQDLRYVFALLQQNPRKELWEQLVNALSPKDIDVPIADLRYLQSSIASHFRQGRHAGQPIEQLVRDLHSGVSLPSDLGLEVVFWHGRYRTLGHRRTWALKAWLMARHASPMTEVRASLLPLVADVTGASGRSAVRRLLTMCETSDGADVRVRREP